MANSEGWVTRFLKSRNLPVTPASVNFLNTWQRYEGGATHNDAAYNYLNTTTGSDYPAINSVGVRRFPNEQVGFDMLDRTLRNGRYGNIVAGLESGDPYSRDISGDLQTWVSGRRDGNPGYAKKVLGARYTSTPPQNTPPAVTDRPKQPVVANPKGFTQADVQASQNRQRSFDLIGQVLAYATEGRVDSNIFANTVQAVSPKGTVEPPVVKNKKTGEKKIPASDNPNTNRMLAFAHKQVGKPYVFGSGPGLDSFDCSDLIQASYKEIGIDIPRVTYDQIKIGRPVKWGEFQPGDLIFSGNGGHVTMYVGGGKVISAPYTGTVVQYQPVSRFKKSFVTAKRVLPTTA